ncbi:MAG: hypothetical protein ACOC70_00765, partial [bacterium]
DDLRLAARGAVRLGIRYLKERQEKVGTGIWFPPKPHQLKNRVGSETYTVTRPAHKVPIRKRVGYKWVWVTEKDPNDPYASVGRKRVKRPIYKIVGYKKVPAKEEERRRYIYEDGNMAKIVARWLEGTNALALYALLESGEPTDSEQVTQAAIWLREATLEQHGLPDTTCELALYLLCFTRLDKKTYGEYTGRVLEKLLRGQITRGDARGLWGVYAVDFDRLRELLRREEKGILIRERLDKETREYRTRMRHAKKTKLLQARIDRNKKLREKLMGEIKKIREMIFDLSRSFSRGTHWSRRRRTERIGGDIRFYPGAFYDALKERHGDLVNTHFALLALREAARNGFFDDGPLREELEPALARAAAAIARLQADDGSWGYGAVSHYLQKPDLTEKQLKKRLELTAEANKPCMSMTAAGLAAMNCIARIADRASVRRKFGGAIDQARAAAIRHLDLYSKPGTKPPTDIATQYSTLYYAFALATALDDPGLVRTHVARIPDGILCRLIFAQEADGSWPKLPRWSFGTARLHRKLFRRRYSRSSTYETYFDHELVNTSFAILFLSQAAKPTAGARWHWTGERDEAADLRLARAADELAEHSKLELRWRTLPAQLPRGLAAFVPTLVAGGETAPERIDRPRLAEFLHDGGLLIVEAASGKTAPITFARRQLKAGFPDLSFRALPDDHPAFGEISKVDDAPDVVGAWQADRLLAVFLPERGPDGEGLSPVQIAQITENLLAARANVKDLDRSRIAGPDDWDEVEKDIEAAIIRLREQHIVPPEEKPDPKTPKSDGPEKKPKDEPAEEPAPPDETPPPDDKLKDKIDELKGPPPDDDKKDTRENDETF